MSGIGASSEALASGSSALASDLRREEWFYASGKLINLAIMLREQNRLGQDDRATFLGLRLGELIDHEELRFCSRLERFDCLAILGRWQDAHAMWNLLDPMGRNWSRSMYRPGDAEKSYALACFYRGNLNESHLANALGLAEKGNNSPAIREIHKLRGRWLLEQFEFALAARSLNHAVQMARAARQYEADAETYLKLAQFHSSDLDNPRHEADQLEAAANVDYLALAELWLAIGDREKAKTWALKAYRRAWADGEPFVFRYALTKSRALLETLGAEIPDLPKSEYEKFPCEDEVVAAIEKLEQEKKKKGSL